MEDNMKELIIRGGIMMYPIIISSIIALAVIIDRIYVLFIKTKFLEKETVNQVYKLAASGETGKAIEILDKETSVFTAFFLAVLREPDSEEQEKAAVAAGDEILFELSRRINILSVLASVLPLMGLLGTVLGMIKVFSRMAEAGDAADITILAGGIWEALLTTAAGMAIAIPVMLIFHYFNLTIERIAHRMQQRGTSLINILKKKEQPL